MFTKGLIVSHWVIVTMVLHWGFAILMALASHPRLLGFTYWNWQFAQSHLLQWLHKPQLDSPRGATNNLRRAVCNRSATRTPGPQLWWSHLRNLPPVEPDKWRCPQHGWFYRAPIGEAQCYPWRFGIRDQALEPKEERHSGGAGKQLRLLWFICGSSFGLNLTILQITDCWPYFVVRRAPGSH